MTGAGLCETCLTHLTADDIGGICTNCVEEWQAYKAEQDDDYWSTDEQETDE